MNTTPTSVAHALLALLLVLSGLDQTLLSAALPAIVRELGGADHSSWVFTAFLVASTVVIPVYGKLADRWGVRPLLLTGAGLFIAGSLGCGLAPTMDTLIAARALQGLGGGGLMTLTLQATAALSTPEERSARMARLGAAYGLATMAGPLAGAFVTQHLSWRWTFFVALPLALCAWAGLARTPMGGRGVPQAVLPDVHPGEHQSQHQAERPPLDWRGALLLAILLVSALLATRSRALGTTTAALMGAAAAALLPVWLWSQRRAADPIVPLSLFSRPGFAANAWLATSTGMSLFAAVVFLPVFLQGVQHLSPTASAAHLLPLMAGLTLASRRAGARLRRGATVVGGGGVGGNGRFSGRAGRAAARGHHIGLGLVGCGAAAGRGAGAGDAGADRRFAARRPFGANGHRHRDADDAARAGRSPARRVLGPPCVRRLGDRSGGCLHCGCAGRPAGLRRRLGAAGPAGADRRAAVRVRLSGVPLGRLH